MEVCPNKQKRTEVLHKIAPYTATPFTTALLTVTLLTVTFLTLGLWSSHGFASKSHGKSGDSSQTQRKKLSESAKKSIVAVLEANEKLHGAFFKYDGKSVETGARTLKSAIDAIKDPEIAKLLKFSKTVLDKIKSTRDRESNNESYSLVSMALIHIVKTYDVGNQYNAYSCPMVKKKWVQNSSKMAMVHNPYAPGMPHCGQQDTQY